MPRPFGIVFFRRVKTPISVTLGLKELSSKEKKTNCIGNKENERYRIEFSSQWLIFQSFDKACKLPQSRGEMIACFGFSNF